MSLQINTTKLQITYHNVANNFPEIDSILFRGYNLDSLISGIINSSQIHTIVQNSLPTDKVILDPLFEKIMSEYFDEIHSLSTTNPSLCVPCADKFFNICGSKYFSLIFQGSKNLAALLLEEILKFVHRWEKKKKRVHKGTPYYFLTYSYREMGDIDCAFASAFKAIREDRLSCSNLFGSTRYKQSPAYRYITLVDGRDNYLYETITNLRNLLNVYVVKYQALTQRNFTINDIDRKFLQHGGNLENAAFTFVYTLELIKKYETQMPYLPSNDFYKIRNLQNIFNLCLVIDKILQHKYYRRFRKNTNNRMYISDGIILLFEDKHWIPRLTPAQKTAPGSLIGPIRIGQNTLPNDISGLINNLVISPPGMTIDLNGTLNRSIVVTPEMRNLFLAHKLRNEGAHSIQRETVLVTKYYQIMESLMFALFASIEML
jgi:hypothetical protein